MGDQIAFNAHSADRHERIEGALQRLSFARQAAPEGGADGVDFYVTRLSQSEFDTGILVQACERLELELIENTFERYKFPLVQDILATAYTIALAARSKKARVECATCDGMRMVVKRRKDGGTCAIPCPTCCVAAPINARPTDGKS